MSSINFLWNGIPPEYRRDSLPPDTMTAENTTYDYSGKVTNEEVINGFKVYEIDRSIKLTTIRREQRIPAQEKLGQMALAGLSLTFGSMAGVGISARRIYKKNDEISYLGMIASIVGICWGIARIEDVGTEFKNWVDPSIAACQNRRKYSQNIVKLNKKDLVGHLFTEEETQDVFFRTMEKCMNHLQEAKNPNNPWWREKELTETFHNCPLTRRLVKSTFKGPYIYNPKIGITNKPVEIDQALNLTEQWEDILNEYHVFKFENQFKHSRKQMVEEFIPEISQVFTSYQKIKEKLDD